MQIQYKVAQLLKGSNYTLSAAESCTGGQISHLITMVSGSSEYFLGSVTSYAISVKESVLSVPAELIKEHGVVSTQVAAAMAEGVRKLTGSTFSVATTGLAEGGDERYPEGTVCIAVSSKWGTETMIYHCNEGRIGNIRKFAVAALKFLTNHIIKHSNN